MFSTTMRLCAALSCVATLVAVPASAQDASSAPSTGDATCILHVWPGSQLRSTYSGWLHGGIVDGAVNGREGYQKLPEAPLDTARQRQLLAKVDIASALGLPGYGIIIHEEALDSRTMRESAGPWTPSPGSCHAELAVDDAFYQEDVFSGRYLKVIYRFRRFANNQTPERSFGQIVAERLVIFPPIKPGDNVQAGLSELGEAFAKSVGDFGTLLQAPQRKKK